jgi:hypothetical protein
MHERVALNQAAIFTGSHINGPQRYRPRIAALKGTPPPQGMLGNTDLAEAGLGFLDNVNRTAGGPRIVDPDPRFWMKLPNPRHLAPDDFGEVDNAVFVLGDRRGDQHVPLVPSILGYPGSPS